MVEGELPEQWSGRSLLPISRKFEPIKVKKKRENWVRVEERKEKEMGRIVRKLECYFVGNWLWKKRKIGHSVGNIYEHPGVWDQFSERTVVESIIIVKWNEPKGNVFILTTIPWKGNYLSLYYRHM